jgi:hypothetical protein
LRRERGKCGEEGEGGESNICRSKNYPTSRSLMMTQCYKIWMLDRKSVGYTQTKSDAIQLAKPDENFQSSDKNG